MALTLTLDQVHDSGGATLRFTDVIAHAGQPKVARFHVARGDSWYEVECVVGDVFAVGEAVFALREVVARDAPVALEPRTRTTATTNGALAVGARAPLPRGRAVQLLGITRHGVLLSVREQSGIENVSVCAFGFLHIDEMAIEIADVDREAAAVKLRVTELARFARTELPDERGVTIGPGQIARRADGLTLELRSAQQMCWGDTTWQFIARRGDDASYPSVTLRRAGGPEARAELTLLAERYTLVVERAEPGPPAAVTVRLAPIVSAVAQPGERLRLRPLTPARTADGLVIRFIGAAHAHGTRLGEDGEEIPHTEAWADIELVHGESRAGIHVELDPFVPDAVHAALGRRVVVHAVTEESVELTVLV